MSRPVLPIPQQDPDSYEARFSRQTDRELQDLKNKWTTMYQGRLAGHFSSTAAPTGGKYMAGDIVRNSAPAVAGGAGSQYVIIGWICTATGNPGTWVEMRTLTGT